MKILAAESPKLLVSASRNWSMPYAPQKIHLRLKPWNLFNFVHPFKTTINPRRLIWDRDKVFILSVWDPMKKHHQFRTGLLTNYLSGFFGLSLVLFLVCDFCPETEDIQHFPGLFNCMGHLPFCQLLQLLRRLKEKGYQKLFGASEPSLEPILKILHTNCKEEE